MASSRQKSPSDAIALIANAFFLLEQADQDADEVARWLENLEPRPFGTAPYPWEQDADDLFRRDELHSLTLPKGAPTTQDEFVALMAALQTLDQWHRPIVPQPDGRVYEKTESHDVILDELTQRARFGACKGGIIIPRYADVPSPELLAARVARYDDAENPMRSAETRVRPRHLLLAQAMDHVSLLPARVEALNPDRRLGKRTVQMEYVRPEANNTPRNMNEPQSELVFAIAPVLQGEHEAGIELADTAGKLYGVQPKYDFARIRRIVRQAITEGAHFLFFPETTVPEGSLGGLSSLINEAVIEHQDSGALSQLQFLFAGIAGTPADAGEKHRNLAVAFDSSGEIVLRQDKMFRWDMERDHIERFGFHRTLNFELKNKTKLKENIAPARSAVIADIPGFGRVVHMICADADYNLPGDWILQHLNVDWLHAPIMDASIGQLPSNGSSSKGSWISKRANRAAASAPTNVIVTNSMSLSHRLNAENEHMKRGRTPIQQCCVGLIVQCGPTPQHIRLEAPIDGPAPVMMLINWNGKSWSVPRRVDCNE